MKTQIKILIKNYFISAYVQEFTISQILILKVLTDLEMWFLTQPKIWRDTEIKILIKNHFIWGYAQTCIILQNLI